MKKPLKNEVDLLDLVNKIQTQLIELDRKISTLIDRSVPQIKPSPTTPPKERTMYTAICADCQKECKIPFKPSGDRPVYCQDCFSRRKVISMSGMKFTEKPKEAASVPAPAPKAKKKAVKAKSKPTPKKK